jgi:hypothetical protein
MYKRIRTRCVLAPVGTNADLQKHQPQGRGTKQETKQETKQGTKQRFFASLLR